MGTIDHGYIKLHRKFLNWEWFSDANTRDVFLYCLLKANWKDKQWHGITIRRGSFVTSRSKIMTDLRLTERQVRVALEHLETTNEVSKYATSKYTVITVIRYDDYQSEVQQNDQQTSNKTTKKRPAKRPTNDQQNDRETSTTKEYKEIEEQEEKEIKPPHPGWIPADSHDGIYVFSHPSSEGWRIEVVDGKEWGYQVEQ